MEEFYYSSSSTHGTVTPSGKKLKHSNVVVENGKGKLTVTVEDSKGTHSDTRVLSSNEVSNIKKHKFMPKLFSSAITNINAAKKNTKKHRNSKQGTRKHK
jgi:hypothetical protein